MSPLNHISMWVDNSLAWSWARCESVRSDTAVVPFLREAAWITRQSRIQASILRIAKVENVESHVASWFTHLLVHILFRHLNYSFPQHMPWRLYHLISIVKPRMHTMLLTKQSPKDCPLQDFTRTTPCGNSWTPSAPGSESSQTSKESVTPSHFFKYFLTMSVQASWSPKTNPSKNAAWINTSALWGGSLRP